jgi:hypothetical protein
MAFFPEPPIPTTFIRANDSTSGLTCGINYFILIGCHTILLQNKPKSPERLQEELLERNKQWNLFLEIWNERPHKSEISGEVLGNQPNSCFFDHLLEKSKYPDIKYEKWNIVLVTIDEHSAKTNGFPKKEHQQLINKAKAKYEKIK